MVGCRDTRRFPLGCMYSSEIEKNEACSKDPLTSESQRPLCYKEEDKFNNLRREERRRRGMKIEDERRCRGARRKRERKRRKSSRSCYLLIFCLCLLFFNGGKEPSRKLLLFLGIRSFESKRSSSTHLLLFTPRVYIQPSGVHTPGEEGRAMGED